MKKPLKLHCNAGYVFKNHKGRFSGIEVWYQPEGIAYIFSLKTLIGRHHVTIDSKDRDGVFKVQNFKGIVEYIPHESGLHY